MSSARSAWRRCQTRWSLGRRFVVRGGSRARRAAIDRKGYAKTTNQRSSSLTSSLSIRDRDSGSSATKTIPISLSGTIRPGTAVHYPAGNPQWFAPVLETEAELNDSVEVERALAGYSHSARGKAEGVLRRCSTGCLQGQWKEGRSSRVEAPSGAPVDDAIDAKHDVGGCGPAVEKTDDSQCLETASIPG
jgi:hypothetical protein